MSSKRKLGKNSSILDYVKKLKVYPTSFTRSDLKEKGCYLESNGNSIDDESSASVAPIVDESDNESIPSFLINDDSNSLMLESVSDEMTVAIEDTHLNDNTLLLNNYHHRRNDHEISDSDVSDAVDVSDATEELFSNSENDLEILNLSDESAETFISFLSTNTNEIKENKLSDVRMSFKLKNKQSLGCMKSKSDDGPNMKEELQTERNSGQNIDAFIGINKTNTSGNATASSTQSIQENNSKNLTSQNYNRPRKSWSCIKAQMIKSKEYQDMVSMSSYSRKRLLASNNWDNQDLIRYREGYSTKIDDSELKQNILFYSNKQSSIPNGDYIDNMHKKWFYDYKLLEAHHGYIQWIFPIRERGMNRQSQVLQKHEAETIKNNLKMRERVLKSYKMMLDFYGMCLNDETSGEITRSSKWKSRYFNLNTSRHNHLRITRILKSLGELGYEHFKAPWLYFILLEISKYKTLSKCRNSCFHYWIGTVKNEVDRYALLSFGDKLDV